MRLAAALRAEIEGGRWQHGQPLPGGSELATACGARHEALRAGAVPLRPARPPMTVSGAFVIP
ncbi:hypothetical protein B6264_29975 (plasmid) [Kitasatospora aureofaciens]|nr:hypothetical protein B6264_29975 [Kitasatospora aureofaciens]